MARGITRGGRRSWRRPLRLLAVALASLAGASATQALAEGPGLSPALGGGCLNVHVGPRVSAGNAASYFRLVARSGRTLHLALVIANPDARTCRVALQAAYGKTALNSGDTYPPAGDGACVRTSCWISGLPATIAIAGRSRVAVPFTVTVPKGTGPGQYLAGVLARPDVRRPSRPRRHPGVGAIVTTNVGIGVAVRVPGPLRPRLTIPAVTVSPNGGTPLIEVVERNGGNTWEHPAGGVVISGGESGGNVRLGISSNTVLPADSATLSVPAVGTLKGSHPVEVVLWYAKKTKRAIWRGRLTFPESVAPAPRSADGTPVVITHARTPGWVVALLGALAAVALLLLALVVLLLVVPRRRRQREEAESDRTPTPAPGP